MEEYKHELVRVVKKFDGEREDLIKISTSKKVLYILLLEHNIVKFGITYDIYEIIQKYKKKFNLIKLKYIVVSENHNMLESEIENELNNQESILCQKKLNITYKYTGMIQLDSDFTFDKLWNYFYKINKNVDSEYNKYFNDKLFIYGKYSELKKENDKLKEEYNKLKEEYDKLKKENEE